MPLFVVHEHHARSLHFDFRLESGGVLKSWAVPKGPSMDPADRRLAIQVEDHELDYADFEGTIPEGEYGAGEVAIWDRGDFSLKSEGMEGDKIEFDLRGKKLKGLFALVRMRGKDRQWLLVKKKDKFAKPGFRISTVISHGK